MKKLAFIKVPIAAIIIIKYVYIYIPKIVYYVSTCSFCLENNLKIIIYIVGAAI